MASYVQICETGGRKCQLSMVKDEVFGQDNCLRF